MFRRSQVLKDDKEMMHVQSSYFAYLILLILVLVAVAVVTLAPNN